MVGSVSSNDGRWPWIGTAAFGFAGLGHEAVVAAEFMGVEAVRRALARQSVGKLGNDRVFIRADNREKAPDAPNPGQLGFNHIGSAVTQLQAAASGSVPRARSPAASTRSRTSGGGRRTTRT